MRASTKKRTIELIAATSMPLPLTSPTSSAIEPFGSRQMPKKSPPPAAWPDGSNTSPASNPSSSGSGPGTKPRVSASATRRSRAKSSALAIAPAAASPNASIRASSGSSHSPARSSATVRTPNSRAPIESGTCANDAMPSSSITQGRNLSRSTSRLAYGSPVCATRPIIPSPTTKRVCRTRSEKPRECSTRRSRLAGSWRVSMTLDAPLRNAA